MSARHRLQAVIVAQALLAGAAPALLAWRLGDGGGGWLTTLSGLAAAAALLGLLALLLLRRRLLAPLDKLAGDLEIQGAAHQFDRPLVLPPAGHALGRLPQGLAAVTEALRAARRDSLRTMENATRQVTEQKRWLEVILLDLSEGVVVCGSADHRILLYNQAALRMLGAPERTGLGRSLFSLVTRQPVLHTFERLDYRRRESPDGGAAELSSPFICASADAKVMLQARMALILDGERQPNAYVVTLTDISGEIAALTKSDAIRRALTRELRGPVAALRAAAETVAAYPDMTIDERFAFERVILKESTVLSERLEQLAAEYRGHAVGRWPMADIHSLDLFGCMANHLAADGIVLTPVGIPLWLHGDSHSLMQVLEELARQIHAHTGVAVLDIEALLGDRRVYVDIGWQGQPIASHAVDAWQDLPIEDGLEHRQMRDVLDRHGSEPWSLARRPGMAVLRVPLLAPHRPQFTAAEARLPPRPEFYDFRLMHAHSQAGALAELPLRQVPYVVFDTETTGLNPSDGDEILSIGAVRVVGGRILTGETFERLVDPGRPIPPGSIRFHGITDDMVRGKPPLSVVLPQFHAFVGDAALAAHNAAFDLKFLTLKEKACGISFTNPVIDTLLLSTLANPAAQDHSLDGLAERLGVRLGERHTALGDALTTAELLVRMFDLIEAQGITTFGELMRRSNMAAEMRQRQTQF